MLCAQPSNPLLEATPVIEPFQQSTDARFRLFPTVNVWNFIELDTATGRLWLVQYSTDNNAMKTAINDAPLAPGAVAGRFTLYQTRNVWNFLLLDQADGRTWQAQFAVGEDDGVNALFPIELQAQPKDERKALPPLQLPTTEAE
jgi:hypothetical protein